MRYMESNSRVIFLLPEEDSWCKGLSVSVYENINGAVVYLGNSPWASLTPNETGYVLKYVLSENETLITDAAKDAIVEQVRKRRVI